MLSANRRSWQQHQVGTLMLTVELDPVADGHSVERHRGLAELTARMAALLDLHRLPATWAVGDPAHSAATSTVLVSNVSHEMAVLGDPTWLGPTAGRTRFARELARRVTQARRANIEVTTLVPRVASVEQDIDLVVKLGFRAVAGIGEPMGRRFQFPPTRALHYGLWEMPVSAKLPVASSWLISGGRSLLRQLRRAARDASMFQLVIDVPAIEAFDPKAEKMVAWLMRHVAQLRDRGMLRVETLGAVAARLSDVPEQAPQQSILRRAG
jgi:hypothetical protein